MDINWILKYSGNIDEDFSLFDDYITQFINNNIKLEEDEELQLESNIMNGIMCFYIINAYNVEIKKYLKKIKDKSEIFYNLLIHEKSKIQHEFIINELNNQLKA